MTLIERLKFHVSFMEQEGEGLDDISWQYQDGIIISGNEAKYIIEKLEETQSPVPDKVEEQIQKQYAEKGNQLASIVGSIPDKVEEAFELLQKQIDRLEVHDEMLLNTICQDLKKAVKILKQSQQSEVEDVLAKAVSVIKQWHNADGVWELYYLNAPEMKPIRDYYQSKIK